MIKSDNKRIVITLSLDEIKKIEGLASDLGVSKSVVIKLALSNYFSLDWIKALLDFS